MRITGFSVRRTLVAGVSLVGACSWFRSRTPARSESIEFAATAQVVQPGDSLLLVRAVARNSGSLTWALQLGQCSMNMRVASLPPAAHVWDYARWRVVSNPRALCIADLAAVQLPPGQSITSDNLERIVRVRDVLGDSLPAGRYRVTVSIDFNNMSSADISAGEVELRAHR